MLATFPQQDHQDLVEAEEDLPDTSDNLFALCPYGGCEALLGEEQRIAFREFHDDLVTAVRVYEPLKRDLSAQPLVLQWVSEASSQRRHVVVAFNVRRPPWDMVLLQLEVPSTHCHYELPVVLKPKREQGQFCQSLLRSDVEFCHELAKDANDWVLFRSKLADLTCDFAEFKVVGQEELTRASLRQAAEEMRQALRAAKAAKLAQGLTAPKKRKKRSAGKQRKNKQARRPLASHLSQGEVSDLDWGSEGSVSFSEEEVEQDDPEAPTPASSSSCLPAGLVGSAESARPHRRTKQARAIPWGPFQLAPIIPASGQTGWGAICGQHCDRGNKLSCKKAVSRGSLTDAECILRLKRWLIAGCSDSNWPVHRQRSHHVELGGKALQDFAQGLSEAEMDALVASSSTA